MNTPRFRDSTGALWLCMTGCSAITLTAAAIGIQITHISDLGGLLLGAAAISIGVVNGAVFAHLWTET